MLRLSVIEDGGGQDGDDPLLRNLQRSIGCNGRSCTRVSDFDLIKGHLSRRLHAMQRDQLLILIYADFERAIDQVRHGADPEDSFRAHETRVAPLRRMVEDMDRSDWQDLQRVMRKR